MTYLSFFKPQNIFGGHRKKEIVEENESLYNIYFAYIWKQYKLQKL